LTLSVPSTLPGVELTASSRYLKLLVHGQTGSGKTRLALTFTEDPRTSPVLWLDPSGGTTGVLEEARANGASIRSAEDTDSVLKFTDWLVAEKGGGFKTLVIDDFSECFSLTKGKVARKFGHTSAEELDPREHAALYERALKVYRAVRKVASPVEAGGAGVHVLLNCWHEQKAARGSDDQMWIPRFAGQFGFQTPAYFDVVAAITHDWKKVKNPATKEVTYEFSNELITSSNEYLTKDRFDLFNGVLAHPTATKIMDALDARNTNREQ
jgi:hypothetical protein